jgi:hypothetical protein
LESCIEMWLSTLRTAGSNRLLGIFLDQPLRIFAIKSPLSFV